jgi:signal peptidase
VGVVFLLAVVGVFVVAAVPQIVGAEESYVIQSDSMSPAIDAGDVVFVYDVPSEKVQTDDIITFEQGGAGESNRVTHRVIAVLGSDGERRFRTKGDANEEPDPTLVAPSRVIGVVKFHIPYIGYVTSFAQSKLGLVALVVIPAILLVASEIWDLATTTEPNGGSSETENRDQS